MSTLFGDERHQQHTAGGTFAALVNAINGFADALLWPPPLCSESIHQQQEQHKQQSSMVNQSVAYKSHTHNITPWCGTQSQQSVITFARTVT